jgi:hypothetical protein
MTFKERLKGVGIALIIVIVCIPMAIIVTLFTTSFWLWIENTFAIESIGHSGPAEWCYLTSYVFLITICTIVWSFTKRQAAEKKPMHDQNQNLT